MNRTEYMNTLQQELQGLPEAVVAETMAYYDKQFTDGAAAGLTEVGIAEKLANPRLVAAQNRANVRFQHLKNDFSAGNIFTLFVAMIGVVVFNFFMLIPAFIYGAFLFAAYLGSLIVYGAGIVVFAASVSGVPQMEFKLPHQHQRLHGNHIYSQMQHREGAVTVNLSESGVEVDKGGHRVGNNGVSDVDKFSVQERHANTLSIKNNMQRKHIFYGLGLLIGGTALLLLCIWMTRLTVVGFGKYFMWNLSLIRATVRSSPAQA
ncbi:DUF1700 domain-containing protein [Undibacterium flavidum]|uniref:DUF1700 domain-containing protein n=1 Tax=Undibacterium flavidum TaxID=2762297 RepID=A0ABR6YGR4_9BURK|nr:DUF1700 domain-containing protein [Undibacterium flavidum]MBC3875726.1 DUF1700 domain-containing protein [Undibacterium flavidum]